jgi:hypothetical protein
MSDEQTSEQPATAPATVEEAETPSDAWGLPISSGRQAELLCPPEEPKGTVRACGLVWPVPYAQRSIGDRESSRTPSSTPGRSLSIPPTPQVIIRRERAR